MNTDKMVEALENFRKAYLGLLLLPDLDDINNTEAIKLYPFNRSFDELGVVEWVDATVEELKGHSDY